MAGTKGRSGRKSLRNDGEVKELYGLSMRTVKSFLKSKASLAARTKVALEIVKKSMPQNINLGGQDDNPVTVNFEKMSKDDLGQYLLQKLRA